MTRDGRVKLAVIGTQVLYCDGDTERATQRIRWSIGQLQPDVVISGGAAGVDTLAAQVAVELGYAELDGTLVVLRPKVPRWHPDGFKDRNQAIARECTHLLRVFCRHSTTYGSGFTYDLAEAQGRSVVAHCVCPSKEAT